MTSTASRATLVLTRLKCCIRAPSLQAKPRSLEPSLSTVLSTQHLQIFPQKDDKINSCMQNNTSLLLRRRRRAANAGIACCVAKRQLLGEGPCKPHLVSTRRAEHTSMLIASCMLNTVLWYACVMPALPCCEARRGKNEHVGKEKV